MYASLGSAAQLNVDILDTTLSSVNIGQTLERVVSRISTLS